MIFDNPLTMTPTNRNDFTEQCIRQHLAYRPTERCKIVCRVHPLFQKQHGTSIDGLYIVYHSVQGYFTHIGLPLLVNSCKKWSLCSALMAFAQGVIFIVSYLL